ncbi:MAG: hypothetical protein LBR16_01475 [Treponema sp.]|nr:hypothetical protein [Treponema sp.]
MYFGELTFYPGSGYEKFLTPEWDGIFGDWLALPAGGAPRFSRANLRRAI